MYTDNYIDERVDKLLEDIDDICSRTVQPVAPEPSFVDATGVALVGVLLWLFTGFIWLVAVHTAATAAFALVFG